MKARIATRLPCTGDELWRRIVEPRSLQHVAAPILRFEPVEPGALDGPWQAGRRYPLRLSFLGLVPLGRHTIELVRIDRQANTIVSHESGRLARVWNHTITFREVAANAVLYADEIEIRAGWLTPVIWLFAQVFYRHRQRRWKALLAARG